MIKEYAVEPAAFIESFLRLYSHFGVNYGRVISDFPQNWINAVLYACPSGFKQKNNLITVLQLLKGRKVFVDGNRTYVKIKTWLDNALEQHYLKPFHCIIAQKNSQGCAEVIIPQGIFENSELFKTETSIIIRRKAEVIAKCAFSLIQYSKEVILVDPHFCKMNSRHTHPLSLLLQMIWKESNHGIRKVVYHSGDDVAEDYHDQKNLASLIPQGMTIELVRWPTKALHNRFVLTDIGGLQFGIGLDENDNDEHPTEDDVSLLDKSNYDRRWQEYKNAEHKRIVVIGTKRVK